MEASKSLRETRHTTQCSPEPSILSERRRAVYGQSNDFSAFPAATTRLSLPSGTWLYIRNTGKNFAFGTARIGFQSAVHIEDHGIALWQGVRLPLRQAGMIGIAASSQGNKSPAHLL